RRSATTTRAGTGGGCPVPPQIFPRGGLAPWPGNSPRPRSPGRGTRRPAPRRGLPRPPTRVAFAVLPRFWKRIVPFTASFQKEFGKFIVRDTEQGAKCHRQSQLGSYSEWEWACGSGGKDRDSIAETPARSTISFDASSQIWRSGTLQPLHNLARFPGAKDCY